MSYFPKISIITPSYNQGQFIEETILSVINQNYPNLEYIVIDGGSTDNTVEIIKKYEKHLTYWVSEKDKGQSDAINKGFKQATGEWVTWLNSDDVYEPNILTKIGECALGFNNNVGLLFGSVTIFDSKGVCDTIETYTAPVVEGFLSGMVFSQPSSFFKRNYLEQVGYLNPLFHYGMDFDLFARLACVSEFKQVNLPIARYRLHDESKSVAEGDKFIDDWSRCFVNLCKNLNWQKELGILKKMELASNVLDCFEAFKFIPNQNITHQIDSQKALCMHLAHVLKNHYWHGNLEGAMKIHVYLKSQPHLNWDALDNRYYKMAKNLNLPLPLLRFLKFLKGFIK